MQVYTICTTLLVLLILGMAFHTGDNSRVH